MRISLQNSTFYNESEMKKSLCYFIENAEILSMSEYCEKAESKFSQKQGRAHSIMVNSGSSANLILIQALLNLGRLSPGDKVAVSALTWSTNIMPIIQLGLTPILVDCETTSLNVESETLLKAYAQYPDIKALFITNVLGFCSDLDLIVEICEANDIILLEDNCESLGSVYRGNLLGNFGLASTFSFFVGHHISAIEGGMVCTGDRDLANELVKVRAHGWDRNLPADSQALLRKKHSVSEFYAKYTFYDLGFNVRPSEINGFIAYMQLDYWDEIVTKRANNFEVISNVLSTDERLLHVRGANMDVVSNFAFPLVAKDSSYAEELRSYLSCRGFEVRPMISGSMGRQPFFKKYSRYEFSTPNADLIHANGFYFGNHPGFTHEDLNFILETLATL